MASAKRREIEEMPSSTSDYSDSDDSSNSFEEAPKPVASNAKPKKIVSKNANGKAAPKLLRADMDTQQKEGEKVFTKMFPQGQPASTTSSRGKKAEKPEESDHQDHLRQQGAIPKKLQEFRDNKQSNQLRSQDTSTSGRYNNTPVSLPHPTPAIDKVKGNVGEHCTDKDKTEETEQASSTNVAEQQPDETGEQGVQVMGKEFFPVRPLSPIIEEPAEAKEPATCMDSDVDGQSKLQSGTSLHNSQMHISPHEPGCKQVPPGTLMEEETAPACPPVDNRQKKRKRPATNTSSKKSHMSEHEENSTSEESDNEHSSISQKKANESLATSQGISNPVSPNLCRKSKVPTPTGERRLVGKMQVGSSDESSGDESLVTKDVLEKAVEKDIGVPADKGHTGEAHSTAPTRVNIIDKFADSDSNESDEEEGERPKAKSFAKNRTTPTTSSPEKSTPSKKRPQDAFQLKSRFLLSCSKSITTVLQQEEITMDSVVWTFDQLRLIEAVLIGISSKKTDNLLLFEGDDPSLQPHERVEAMPTELKVVLFREGLKCLEKKVKQSPFKKNSLDQDEIVIPNTMKAQEALVTTMLTQLSNIIHDLLEDDDVANKTLLLYYISQKYGIAVTKKTTDFKRKVIESENIVATSATDPTVPENVVTFLNKSWADQRLSFLENVNEIKFKNKANEFRKKIDDLMKRLYKLVFASQVAVLSKVYNRRKGDDGKLWCHIRPIRVLDELAAHFQDESDKATFQQFVTQFESSLTTNGFPTPVLWDNILSVVDLVAKTTCNTRNLNLSDFSAFNEFVFADRVNLRENIGKLMQLFLQRHPVPRLIEDYSDNDLNSMEDERAELAAWMERTYSFLNFLNEVLYKDYTSKGLQQQHYINVYCQNAILYDNFLTCYLSCCTFCGNQDPLYVPRDVTEAREASLKDQNIVMFSPCTKKILFDDDFGGLADLFPEATSKSRKTLEDADIIAVTDFVEYLMRNYKTNYVVREFLAVIVAEVAIPEHDDISATSTNSFSKWTMRKRAMGKKRREKLLEEWADDEDSQEVTVPFYMLCLALAVAYRSETYFLAAETLYYKDTATLNDGKASFSPLVVDSDLLIKLSKIIFSRMQDIGNSKQDDDDEDATINSQILDHLTKEPFFEEEKSKEMAKFYDRVVNKRIRKTTESSLIPQNSEKVSRRTLFDAAPSIVALSTGNKSDFMEMFYVQSEETGESATLDVKLLTVAAVFGFLKLNHDEALLFKRQTRERFNTLPLFSWDSKTIKPFFHVHNKISQCGKQTAAGVFVVLSTWRDDLYASFCSAFQPKKTDKKDQKNMLVKNNGFVCVGNWSVFCTSV